MHISFTFSLRHWLPAQIQRIEDQVEALRARILLILMLFCIVPLLAFFVVLVAFTFFMDGDYAQGALVIAGVVFAQAGCLAYFMKSANVRHCALFYVTNISTLVGLAALLTGGWDSPACIFMLVLPAMGCLVLDRLSCAIFALAVLGLYTLFFILSENGVVATQLIPAELLPYFHIGMWLTTLGFIVGCLYLFDFVTEDLALGIERERQQWQRDVDMDELTTTLKPKRFIEITVRDQLSNQENQDRAAIYIQLVNLKKVNQGFGFDAGDHVLKVMTDRMRGVLGEEVEICRYTPDSFVIYLKNLKDVGELISLIFRLKTILHVDILFRDEILLNGVLKIGAAVSADPAITAHDLLIAAKDHASEKPQQIYIRK